MQRAEGRQAQRLQDAMRAHQTGRLEEARLLYERVLGSAPHDPDALHFFGVLKHNMGDSAAAVGLIRRSLKIAPANEHAWLNLGNILLEGEQVGQALVAYRKVCELAPRLADGWYNLGICQRRQEDPAAAAASLERAVSLRPRHAPSHYQRGIAQRDAGDLAAAEIAFREALAITPDYTEVYESLGMLLYRQNRIADAAAVYGAWLAIDPTNSTAAHLSAAMSGSAVPLRGSDEYVRETFDRFAATFDQNLSNLGYRAPALVSTALERMLDGTVVDAVLDAGCGTGLCAEPLRPLTRRLVGVDLSAGMVDLARAKGRYEELHVAELCSFMESRPRTYDAVVSADTLVYFGALEAAFSAAAISLKSRGRLVFTLEALVGEAGQGYRLEPHGRYSHAVEYIRSALASAGFGYIDLQHEVLRRERGADVQGFLVSAELEE
jgi:predicted TPR repeat methyltransferase